MINVLEKFLVSPSLNDELLNVKVEKSFTLFLLFLL